MPSFQTRTALKSRDGGPDWRFINDDGMSRRPNQLPAATTSRMSIISVLIRLTLWISGWTEVQN
jgi:hypothetical protein